MSLGRIQDYSKKLPIVELYYCVQSEGSRAGFPTVAVEQQDVLTDVGLVKVAGVILGTQAFILKKVDLHLMTLLRCMMIDLILLR